MQIDIDIFLCSCYIILYVHTINTPYKYSHINTYTQHLCHIYLSEVLHIMYVNVLIGIMCLWPDTYSLITFLFVYMFVTKSFLIHICKKVKVIYLIGYTYLKTLVAMHCNV